MELLKERFIIERRNRHIRYGLLVVLICLLEMYWALDWSLEHFAALVYGSGFVVMALHLTWRTCMFLEELHHVRVLCSSSYIELLKRSFTFNSTTVSVTIVITLVLTATFQSPYSGVLQKISEICPFQLCFGFFAFSLLFSITRAEQCLTWEAHTMRQMNGLDYGSGMAHSYFHGYLKLILPATGDNNLSIQERIHAFMEKHHITNRQFPVRKLIVLIPWSGYTYPILNNDPALSGPDPDIEPAEMLQDHLRNRAGSKGRVYRGGAYRIRDGLGGFMYTLAEGATPLVTLYEAYSCGTPDAEHIRKHKVDIMSNFCLTLENLIQERECRGLVELLYYNDEKQPVNLVTLLRDHLLRSR